MPGSNPVLNKLSFGLLGKDWDQLNIGGKQPSSYIQFNRRTDAFFGVVLQELLKLRKKITTTVQVLTHLKEKLQFVQVRDRHFYYFEMTIQQYAIDT